MRRHSLFLLQGRDVQIHTLETMQSWSAAGLLHPVSFLDLDDVREGALIQDLTHRVLTGGSLSDPVPLLDWLAGNYCDVLRLVTLHTATQQDEETDGVRKAEHLRSDLEQWTGPQQRVVALACFLVDPEQAQFRLRSALPTWSANLVISPTDQALPSGAAAPVRATTSTGDANLVFAQLASQNLCTVGGAWRFMEDGPMDAARPDSQAAGVQVVRSFVRCVAIEDPTPGLTDKALRPTTIDGRAGWQVPQARPGLVPATPAAVFAGEAAEQLGARHAGFLDAELLDPPTPRPRRQLRLWAALKMFFGYLVKGAKAAPRLIIDNAVAAASTAASTIATNAIFGTASEYEIKVGRPRQRLTADTEALQRAIEAAVRIADPTSTFMPPATRELWQEYLRVGIALVDGSAMPPDQTRPQIGDAPAVIQSPSEVVASPEHEEHVVPGRLLDQFSDSRLSVGDPLGILLTLDILRARESVLAGTNQPVEGPLGSETPAPSDAPPLVAPGTETSADAAVPPPETTDPSETKRRKDLEECQREISDIEQWMAAIGQPYSWRIGLRVAHALREAQGRFLLASALLQQLAQPKMNESEIRAKRIWRALGAGAAVAVVAVALGILGWVDWDWAGPIAVIGFLLGFIISFRSFVSDVREQFRMIHAYESGIDELEETRKAFAHYARETLRLSSVYWQYLQWTPVLGAVLHKPFAAVPPDFEAAPQSVITDSPKSTRVGTATKDPVKVEALTSQARQRIFTRGWAFRCWEASAELLLEDFRTRNAISVPLDPFDENLRQRLGALEYLRSGFERGAYGAASRREPVASTRELVTSRGLSSLTSEVLVDGSDPYPDAPAPPGSDPADGLFRELLPSVADGPFAASLWRSGGLVAPVDVRRRIISMEREWRLAVADNREEHRSEDVVFTDAYPIRRQGQLVFAAARVDLSEPCAPHELVMFEDIEDGPSIVVAEHLDDDGD